MQIGRQMISVFSQIDFKKTQQSCLKGGRLANKRLQVKFETQRNCFAMRSLLRDTTSLFANLLIGYWPHSSIEENPQFFW